MKQFAFFAMIGAAMSVDAQNLVQNPNFDTDAADWTCQHTPLGAIESITGIRRSPARCRSPRVILIPRRNVLS